MNSFSRVTAIQIDSLFRIRTALTSYSGGTVLRNPFPPASISRQPLPSSVHRIYWGLSRSHIRPQKDLPGVWMHQRNIYHGNTAIRSYRPSHCDSYRPDPVLCRGLSPVVLLLFHGLSWDRILRLANGVWIKASHK